MAYSLECRSPFLSKKIIEWSQTLQTNQKVNFFYKKIILKKLAKKYLPDEIVNKKKRGFELPIKNWLRSDLKEWAENLICEEKNYKNLPFKKEKVLNLLKLHLSKKRDCHSYLWTILMVLKYNENHLTK
jgi:asparagine synthase (glutamine-hydrolysing)